MNQIKKVNTNNSNLDVFLFIYYCSCNLGKPIQLHLQACDVKSKEEKSGPENMLTEPNTGDGMVFGVEMGILI